MEQIKNHLISLVQVCIRAEMVGDDKEFDRAAYSLRESIRLLFAPDVNEEVWKMGAVTVSRAILEMGEGPPSAMLLGYCILEGMEKGAAQKDPAMMRKLQDLQDEVVDLKEALRKAKGMN